MRGEGTKPSQPLEAGSLANIGAKYWPARQLGVWLNGADLALEAIREREYMLLLEGAHATATTKDNQPSRQQSLAPLRTIRLRHHSIE
jgi:hypothetical protein